MTNVQRAARTAARDNSKLIVVPGAPSAQPKPNPRVSPVRAALNQADRKSVERKMLAPSEVPGKALFWRIVLAPYVAQYGGSIQVADITEQAEKVACSVGRILYIGHFAFKSTTVAGLNLAEEPNIPKVGDYVLHELYAGTDVKLKGDRRIRIINETDILMVLDDPDQIRGYL